MGGNGAARGPEDGVLDEEADEMTYPCLIRSILVGGLEHFLFSHILGIIIPID